MLRKVCGCLLGGIPTIILSFIACILSLFTVISCDYVRLNFASLNEFNRVFKEPSWFGLGFLNHQNYDDGKSASNWEHNTTCYTYDELSIENFRSSSLQTALGPAITSLIMIFLVFILASVSMCLKKSTTRAVIRGISFVLSLLSFVFQIVAYKAAFDDENGGVCDPSSYEYWYDSYPHLEYPEVRYMRFFKECTPGPGSKLAVVATVFQIITTVWLALNACVSRQGLFEDDEEDVDLKKQDRSAYDSVIPVEPIPLNKPRVAFVDNEEVTEEQVKLTSLKMPYNEETEKEPIASSPNSEKTHPAFEEVEVVESGIEEETVPLTIAAVKSEEDVQEVGIIVEKEETDKEEDIMKKEEDVEEETEVKREDFEKVEDIEEDVDLPPLVQKKAPETKDAKIAQDAEPQIAKKEKEIADKEDVEEEEGNDAADAVSLYTTDVRKEGEATVGNVRIASMKSGRF